MLDHKEPDSFYCMQQSFFVLHMVVVWLSAIPELLGYEYESQEWKHDIKFKILHLTAE